MPVGIRVSGPGKKAITRKSVRPSSRRISEDRWNLIPDEKRAALRRQGLNPESDERQWRADAALVAERMRHLPQFEAYQRTGLDKDGFDSQGLWQGWDVLRQLRGGWAMKRAQEEREWLEWATNR